ncbi:ankyrin repeat domain-containing protein [Aspergillus mulundensis]|uniref:F-box domain-containing protein n=1 Tax=Aspergillus mulundensis TaxID=1810919 RepID=A0A3D8T687_9EURO|nr:hypothetical protein DSM5745_01399 [Aspergillus mulundensis]RDW94077.1 hypothetical protein DSM5745_01399 [Aspergillus mulundensis]
MSLTSLPCELILCIAEYLAPQDLNHFVRTDGKYYRFLNTRLYQQNFSIALAWAICADFLPTLRKCVDLGADIQSASLTPFGYIPNSNDRGLITPFELAVKCHSDDMAAFLLEQGASPRSFDWEMSIFTMKLLPQTFAARFSMPKNLDFEMPIIDTKLLPKTFMALFDRGLFSRCKDKDRGAAWALQQMVQFGCETGARMLLERTDLAIDIDRVRIRDPPYTGASALTIAARYGDVKLVQLLLEHGASVDLRGNDGETPLLAHLGAGLVPNPSEQIVKLLVEAGADVNARDCLGRTPLWNVAGNTQTLIWDYLLEHGGDAEIHDEDGISATMRVRYFKFLDEYQT